MITFGVFPERRSVVNLMCDGQHPKTIAAECLVRFSSRRLSEAYGFLAQVLGDYEPEWAFVVDFYENEKPDPTRRYLASGNPEFSLKYALMVDKGPHEVTRYGVLSSATSSYMYAITIDKTYDKRTLHAAYKDKQALRNYIEAVPNIPESEVELAKWHLENCK